MSNGPAAPSSNSLPMSFYNDSTDSISLASQLSPGLQSALRGGPVPLPGMQDSPDYNDGRRPSVASVTTTASSTGSKASGTRGGFRKLQGFFGEEFPGRDSSESSLPTSLTGKDQRSRSYSHTRPTHRDRNYSNATDPTREGSPSSSRPRTPVPAPEVVPFLYQDNTVRTHFSSTEVYCVLPHCLFNGWLPCIHSFILCCSPVPSPLLISAAWSYGCRNKPERTCFACYCNTVPHTNSL